MSMLVHSRHTLPYNNDSRDIAFALNRSYLLCFASSTSIYYPSVYSNTIIGQINLEKEDFINQ